MTIFAFVVSLEDSMGAMIPRGIFLNESSANRFAEKAKEKESGWIRVSVDSVPLNPE